MEGLLTSIVIAQHLAKYMSTRLMWKFFTGTTMWLRRKLLHEERWITALQLRSRVAAELNFECTLKNPVKLIGRFYLNETLCFGGCGKFKELCDRRLVFKCCRKCVHKWRNVIDYNLLYHDLFHSNAFIDGFVLLDKLPDVISNKRQRYLWLSVSNSVGHLGCCLRNSNCRLDCFRLFLLLFRYFKCPHVQQPDNPHHIE